MPHIPLEVAEDDLSNSLQKAGLIRIHQGKVRDTYQLPGHPNLLLVVATDRISIFDFVLSARVKAKGIILTQLTDFWLRKKLRGIQHHLLDSSLLGIDQYLPVELRRLKHLGLEDRALVVKKLSMIPVECIVRGYNTGSGYKAYVRTGKVCGIPVRMGMQDGERFDTPLFTPSTKAESGHDVNLTPVEAMGLLGARTYQALKRLSLSIYEQGAAYALSRGFILADTKFEFGVDENQEIRLADEVLTPDSSRYWWLHDWGVSPLSDKPPSGYDKEPVRQAGKKAILPGGTSLDISSLKDPDDPDQIRLVQSWEVPKEVLTATNNRYCELRRILVEGH